MVWSKREILTGAAAGGETPNSSSTNLIQMETSFADDGAKSGDGDAPGARPGTRG